MRRLSGVSISRAKRLAKTIHAGVRRGGAPQLERRGTWRQVGKPHVVPVRRRELAPGDSTRRTAHRADAQAFAGRARGTKAHDADGHDLTACAHAARGGYERCLPAGPPAFPLGSADVPTIGRLMMCDESRYSASASDSGGSAAGGFAGRRRMTRRRPYTTINAMTTPMIDRRYLRPCLRFFLGLPLARPVISRRT